MEAIQWALIVLGITAMGLQTLFGDLGFFADPLYRADGYALGAALFAFAAWLEIRRIRELLEKDGTIGHNPRPLEKRRPKGKDHD